MIILRAEYNISFIKIGPCTFKEKEDVDSVSRQAESREHYSILCVY